MDEDQLDILCLGANDGIDTMHFTEELTCSRMRGKFRSNRRTVPRLPLVAMISRMKLLEDSSNDNVVKGRGRAQIISDRARHYRQPGHSQRKPVEIQNQLGSADTLPTGRRMKSKHVYNNNWEQEEFPSLGFEHTVDGSPKKKYKSDDCNSETRKEEKNDQTYVLDNSGDHKPIHHNREPVMLPRNASKARTKVKKKVFDFTKANQSLLEEFPFPQQTSQVVNLTQQNLEKFLRESDNESNCSPQDIVHEPVKEFEDDDVPLYQKYAVTLDDIMRSRYTQVPFNLKGQLASLLNTADSYHTNPNEYFEKTDALHLAPEASAEIPEQKKVSGANSTNSVASELSDLNSPSENEEEMELSEQRAIADAGGKTAGSNMEQNIIKGKEDFNLNNEAEMSKELTDSITAMHNGIVCGCESSDKMINIDDVEDKDDVRFDAATSKHPKKNSSDNSAPVTPSHDASWKLHGRKVIQINGLPAQCDQMVLHDYVREFGAITDFEVHLKDGFSSLRFQLESEDACDYAVQCLHDADCLYPETNCKLSCEHLQM